MTEQIEHTLESWGTFACGWFMTVKGNCVGCGKQYPAPLNHAGYDRVNY